MLRLFILLLLSGLLAMTHSEKEDLQLPVLEDGLASPGKRVAVVPPEYKGTGEIANYLTDYKSLAEFVLLDILVKKIFPQIPNALMIHPHTDRWLFVDSRERRQVGKWMEKVIQSKKYFYKRYKTTV